MPAFFHQLYSLLAIKGRNRPKLRLQGSVVPTVDVFVTCCKEDVNVVLDTTRAGKLRNIQYADIYIQDLTHL